MKVILYGVLFIVIYVVVRWIIGFAKATKDPDVLASADLQMDIRKFKHYQRLYDEYDQFMREHGIHSKESEKKFVEIFKQIDNPNEWQRYQEYRLQNRQK